MLFKVMWVLIRSHNKVKVNYFNFSGDHKIFKNVISHNKCIFKQKAKR
jgi:hypothetical protein